MAAEDVAGIYRYLRTRAGLETARRYVAALYDKFEWIALSGSTGVSRDPVSPGLRMLRHRKHLIFFRATTSECRIVRVLHSRQDLTQASFVE